MKQLVLALCSLVAWPAFAHSPLDVSLDELRREFAFEGKASLRRQVLTKLPVIHYRPGRIRVPFGMRDELFAEAKRFSRVLFNEGADRELLLLDGYKGLQTPYTGLIVNAELEPFANVRMFSGRELDTRLFSRLTRAITLLESLREPAGWAKLVTTSLPVVNDRIRFSSANSIGFFDRLTERYREVAALYGDAERPTWFLVNVSDDTNLHALQIERVSRMISSHLTRIVVLQPSRAIFFDGDGYRLVESELCADRLAKASR